VKRLQTKKKAEVLLFISQPSRNLSFKDAFYPYFNRSRRIPLFPPFLLITGIGESSKFRFETNFYHAHMEIALLMWEICGWSGLQKLDKISLRYLHRKEGAKV